MTSDENQLTTDTIPRKWWDELKAYLACEIEVHEGPIRDFPVVLLILNETLFKMDAIEKRDLR